MSEIGLFSPGIHPEDAISLHNASLLYRSLLKGGPMPFVQAPPGTPLRPGEHVHLTTRLSHEVRLPPPEADLPGAETLIHASRILRNMLGDPRRRTFAELPSAAHWRTHGTFLTLLTSEGILACAGTGWIRLPLRDFTRVWARPKERAVILEMHGLSPVRLSGPWATFAAVALVSLVSGRAHLAQLPELHFLHHVRPPIVPLPLPREYRRRVPYSSYEDDNYDYDYDYDYDDDYYDRLEQQRRWDEEDERRRREEEEEEDTRRRQQQIEEEDDYYYERSWRDED
ncbi:hypothetical protein [Actinocorallia sp. A-T 12471]|uniref:hypothetical protein n=1 Tax=Actinocorallia sp. A-T 12471 TaxID=3089813 RepID=UPI0029CE7F9D|nr:hypothetical protein [Actinocorallia sp. A-T 12471]MDX6739032.1 hypothetical protein [Actinocorallia sp. A-T 12471]